MAHLAAAVAAVAAVAVVAVDIAPTAVLPRLPTAVPRTLSVPAVEGVDVAASAVVLPSGYAHPLSVASGVIIR